MGVEEEEEEEEEEGLVMEVVEEEAAVLEGETLLEAALLQVSSNQFKTR